MDLFRRSVNSRQHFGFGNYDTDPANLFAASRRSVAGKRQPVITPFAGGWDANRLMQRIKPMFTIR